MFFFFFLRACPALQSCTLDKHRPHRPEPPTYWLQLTAWTALTGCLLQDFNPEETRAACADQSQIVWSRCGSSVETNQEPNYMHFKCTKCRRDRPPAVLWSHLPPGREPRDYFLTFNLIQSEEVWLFRAKLTLVQVMWMTKIIPWSNSSKFWVYFTANICFAGGAHTKKNNQDTAGMFYGWGNV